VMRSEDVDSLAFSTLIQIRRQSVTFQHSPLDNDNSLSTNVFTQRNVHICVAS